jgi:glucose/arabinose dehydrogenase
MDQRLVGVFFGVVAATHASSLMYVSSSSNNEVLQYSGFTGAAVNDPLVNDPTHGLHTPQGLAFSPGGDLYVASWYDDEILKYNGTTGAWEATIVSSLLKEPTGMVFGPDGNLYVASQTSADVLQYNPITGKFSVFASADMSNPYGLAFDSAGNLYVANNLAGNVTEYDSTGKYKATFASGLVQPSGLVFDRQGNLFVSDYGTGIYNSGVKEYSSSGSLIRTISLSTPTGLGIGPDGNVYVASYTGDDVLEYSDRDGSFIKTFVSSGSSGPIYPTFLMFETTPEPGTFFLAGSLLAVFAISFRRRRRP